MLVIVFNVISLVTASVVLVLSILTYGHALRVLHAGARHRSGSVLMEWVAIVIFASVIAARMVADVNWVDVTVSLIFLAAIAVHLRILRVIHKASAE